MRLAFSDLNNNGRIEYADNLATPANESEIMQEEHYYPFGLNQVGDWYATTAPENKYQFNGKELNEEMGINWVDFGNRWQDPALGRFMTIDRFAEKYYALTPYGYAANNPILFIDVNGDSINVSDLREKSPDDYEKLEADLEKITGLILSADDDGNLTYEVPEGKLEGSKRARKMLMKAIDNKETVNAKDNRGMGSNVPMESADSEKQNELNFDFDQVDAFVKGTSTDLNPQTYGSGMNFLHELGHTRVGGRKLDWRAGNVHLIGNNIVNENRIRRQLGRDYGKRVDYTGYNVKGDESYIYYAFSKATLRSLERGILPASSYIKVPRR